MAISYLAIQHDTTYTSQGIYDLVYPAGKTSSTTNKHSFGRQMVKYFSGVDSGAYNCAINATVVHATAAAFASATATIVHANLSDGDTIVVGGVTITARAGAAVANEFTIGADATADGVALAAAFNASVSNNIAQFVTANANTGVVTFTCKLPGSIGNLITLTTNDATAYTLSAAVLGGGSTGATNGTTFSFGFGK